MSSPAIRRSRLLTVGFLSLLCAEGARAQSNDKEESPAPPRHEVLFLGSENISNHDPIARFRVIRQALGPRGVNFTYAETLDALTPENLARFDVLLIFANHYTIDKPTQGKALIDFARNGGGCVLLHCAAGCFRDSQFDDYVDLLGAQFDRHDTGVFRPEIVAPEHPIMHGYEGFECWDETYVHKRHGADRTLLQKRGDEPWTWVKTYGQGRVFYTASGHDERCWGLPAYHDLLYRALVWTSQREAPVLPKLEYRPAKVPENPANPVGPNNQLQLPLSPAGSMTLAQVPPGFALRLFAAEPMVVNPIALNWDERGRLWVVEALNYPHDIEADKRSDRISILEDTDGDGTADRKTIFADGLNLCTSVLPVVDGAIATSGTDVVFIPEDKAAPRRIIFTGIKLDDTHAIVSNLHYGFDNWIHATVGYSGMNVEIGGQYHDFSMAVFRFRADGSAFEVIQHTSNNTWGLAFTEEGDVIGSTANNNPSWYVSIPNRAYAAAQRPPAKVPSADLQDMLYPITSDYFQNWPKERSSSGSGHALYSGHLFPESWWNRRAFVCEPPMHLVAAPDYANVGTRFEASRFEQNLYASADAWSAPVAAEVGPDGAVWLADWYGPVLNHNVYRPDHQIRGAGNAYVTPDRDREHGRIYRIVPENATPDPYPDLSTPAAQVEALRHPDLFWRITAQRLLVHGDAASDEKTIAALFVLATEDIAPASLHALRVLEGVLPSDDPRLREIAGKLVASPHRGVASAALAILPHDEAHRARFLEVLRDSARHPMVRKDAALALLDLPPDPNLGADLIALVSDPGLTDHLATAVRLVCLRHPEGFVRELLEKGTVPDHGLLQRAFAEALEILQRDKTYLSPGLLAVARASDNEVARQVTEAAGAVPPPVIPEHLSESARRGRDVYLFCVACHQPTGEGVPGAFPALAGSPRVLGPESTLARIILKGLIGPLESQGVSYNGVMPGHEAALTDQQIADVASYLRNSWGNRAADVPAETITETRADLRDRKQPWTQRELTP